MTYAKNATRPRQEPAKDSPKRELPETKWGGGTPPKGGFQLNKKTWKNATIEIGNRYATNTVERRYTNTRNRNKRCGKALQHRDALLKFMKKSTYK